QLAEARVRAIVAIIDLPAGPWSPDPLSRLTTSPFALLVVDGLLVRELLLGGSTATELLGACDVVDLGVSDDALLPTQARWSVPDTARVVVLDDRVLSIVRAWPSVARTLLDRAARRGARLSTHRAIAQLPRVDQRLMAFFGHLAERWGRVASSGVVIPLHLTHETLGRLIGARRPTVSLALKDLAATGVLERRSDGAWVLSYEAFEALRSGDGEQTAWQPAEARPLPDAVGPVGARPRVAGDHLRAEDIADLHNRVALLKAQHETRMTQSAVLLKRSQEARETFRRRNAPQRASASAAGDGDGDGDGRSPADELLARRQLRSGV
ncbi:MAG: family transcriptional regulator, cyclic receptor protein, partial [Thermoleophilaceae bacterium]|nr:family transcriptional regulator, cyclic receptor protein [Thermoleophilaceae bacterium]